MKLRIELDGAQVVGTKVWVDGVDVTSRTASIAIEHAAGKLPKLKVKLLKLIDGEPYLDEETGKAASEIITN